MTTRGKIFIKPLAPKLVSTYQKLFLFRPSGLVEILNILPTRIEYKFVGEPTILSSFNRLGFGILVAYLPHLEEDRMYIPVCKEHVLKIYKSLELPNGTYEFGKYGPFEDFEINEIPLREGDQYARLARFCVS